MHIYLLQKCSRYILPFTVGGFLNIALVSVVPELMEVLLTFKYILQQESCENNQCFKIFIKSENEKKINVSLKSKLCYRRKDLGQHFCSSSAYWQASVLCPCSPWCRCTERSLMNISSQYRLFPFSQNNAMVPIKELLIKRLLDWGKCKNIILLRSYQMFLCKSSTRLLKGTTVEIPRLGFLFLLSTMMDIWCEARNRTQCTVGSTRMQCREKR